MGSNDVQTLKLANGVPQFVVGELLDQMETARNEEKTKRTQADMLRDAVSAVLGELGALSVQDDSLIFSGTKIILPEQYKGDPKKAAQFINNWVKQQEERFDFSRTMPYRPYDGAHAFMETMQNLTGTAGFGVARQTMFGPQPPEFKTIDVGVGKTTQVPWGQVAYPMFEALFDVGYQSDPEKGVLFALRVNAPRKYRPQIHAIFEMIEKHVQENSIYKGQAVTGAAWPEFIDTTTVDPTHVVYSTDVMEQLTAHVWSPIRYTNAMRARNIPVKRAILFAGPYGTGKSMGAMLTAQEAVTNGWTFVMCRTGKDDPATVLQTAALYAPAVVVIEDLDVHAAGTSALDISRLLEMLDGVTNKGKEIVALFTTNHIEEIQKGALRPGRVDAVIEIAGLDRQGFEKLIKISLGVDFLESDIDWDAVAAAYDGFLPAFVKEAALRSQRYTMSRNRGIPGVIGTLDLIRAADSLRPQLELMDGAKEGVRMHTINDQMAGIFANVLERTYMPDYGDDFEVREPTVLNGGAK